MSQTASFAGSSSGGLFGSMSSMSNGSLRWPQQAEATWRFRENESSMISP